MKKIRILYIQVPAGGGSLIALYEMIKQLKNTFVEPIILCTEKNKYTQILETLSCEIYYLREHTNNNSNSTLVTTGTLKKIIPNVIYKNIKNIYKYFKADKKFVKQFLPYIASLNIDLVHHNNDVSINRNFIRICNKLKVPQIVHNRSLQEYQSNQFYYWIDKKLAKKINYYINISQAVKDHFTRIYHLKTYNNEVIRDMVDTQKLIESKPDDNFLKTYNLNAQENIIIANIGRIISWKGQDVFIKAIKKVTATLPNIKALIVGSYEKGVGDENYYYKLLQLVNQLQLNNHIVFTGNVANISTVLNAAQIIVHTSTKPEPQGLVIIEALCCNKPVIVSKAGGAEELIKLYGGLATPLADVDALANAIIYTLENKDELLRKQQTLKEKLLQDFNPSFQVNQIITVYKKILNRNV